MSLEQNDKKIKSVIQGLVVLQVILISYLFTHIYSVYNRGDGPEFLIEHFEVDFLSKNNHEAGNSDFEKDDSVSELQIIASINGARYYYLHCSGVGRIKDENRVYFATEKDAESAGYSIALNCKK